jgi:hypothetical protein
MAVMSIRFADDRHHDRLKAAAARRGVAMSPLAEELIEEGLRMREHPQIAFRDGPTGRRPVLLAGPEVIDVVGAIVGGDVSPADRRARAAELMAIPLSAVDAALGYYAAHTAEVDAALADRLQLADELEAQWRRAQELLGS